MEFRRRLFRSRVQALAKRAGTARDGAPQAVIAAAKPNGGKPLTVRAFADGDYRAFLIAKKARNRDTAQARVDEAIARTLRILGDLAGWHLSDITRNALEALLHERAKAVAASTLGRDRTAINSLLAYAVKRGLLTEHPLPGVDHVELADDASPSDARRVGNECVTT